MKKLTVATYNVAHCLDFNYDKQNRPVDIEKTGLLIKSLNVDFIGLNEVYDNSEKEELNKQTEKLLKFTQMNYGEFALGYDFSWGVIGNSILSKYPIVNVEKIPVPAPPENERFEGEKIGFEDRVIIKSIIDVGQKICVISTHFGLNKSEQLRMTDALVKILDNETIPCILMGDFNVSPDSEILQPIYQRLTSVADVTDKRYVNTFSSFNPHMTIDYIFVSKEFEVDDFAVLDVILSDHKPLVTSLTLK